MSAMLRKTCYSFSKRNNFYLRRCLSRSWINRAAQEEENAEAHVTQSGLRYVVRSLTHPDVPQLFKLARDPKSTDCVPCVHSWIEADPHGIKVAITSTDEIAGACGSVMNGDSEEDGLCFGGLFFVQEKYHSQGIGRKLWSSCFKHIGDRNGALNAAPGKLKIYQESGGFPLHDASFTSLEYHTTSWPLDFTSFSDIPPPGIDIRNFDQNQDLPAIFAYDESLVGFRRFYNMRLNLLEAGSKTLVAFGGGGAFVGFGTVKVTYLGAVRIGPLYADDPKVAEALLKRLVGLHQEAGGFLFVTTSQNAVAMEWMERLGVKVREECDRLYIKRVLEVDHSKVFAQFDVNFSPF